MRVNYGFIGAYLPEENHDVVLKSDSRQCHLARCSIFCLGKQMVLPQNEVTHDFAP